jgi:hypothetical protein
MRKFRALIDEEARRAFEKASWLMTSLGKPVPVIEPNAGLKDIHRLLVGAGDLGPAFAVAFATFVDTDEMQNVTSGKLTPQEFIKKHIDRQRRRLEETMRIVGTRRERESEDSDEEDDNEGDSDDEDERPRKRTTRKKGKKELDIGYVLEKMRETLDWDSDLEDHEFSLNATDLHRLPDFNRDRAVDEGLRILKDQVELDMALGEDEEGLAQKKDERLWSLSLWRILMQQTLRIWQIVSWARAGKKGKKAESLYTGSALGNQMTYKTAVKYFKLGELLADYPRFMHQVHFTSMNMWEKSLPAIRKHLEANAQDGDFWKLPHELAKIVDKAGARGATLIGEKRHLFVLLCKFAKVNQRQLIEKVWNVISGEQDRHRMTFNAFDDMHKSGKFRDDIHVCTLLQVFSQLYPEESVALWRTAKPHRVVPLLSLQLAVCFTG